MVSPGMNVYSPKISNQALARRFVALNGYGYVAITIHDGVNAVDPDPGTLSLKVWYRDPLDPDPPVDPRGEEVVDVSSVDITKADTGMYHYAIGPQYTGARGLLTAQWSYQVSGKAFTYDDHMQILEQMPLYESLSDAEKGTVEQVSWMFADLFDSTEGGPHLMDEFQTHFNYERIAQLAQVATTRFNTTGFPVTTYEFGGTSSPSQFAGVLVIGTYLEIVRHLMRSYIEIPLWQNMNITYEDRREYFQRWKTLFDTEWPEYKEMVKMAKRSLLSLGRGKLLLGGGYFGGNSGMRGLFIFSPYTALARSFRFYPAAPAVSFPSTRIP